MLDPPRATRPCRALRGGGPCSLNHASLESSQSAYDGPVPLLALAAVIGVVLAAIALMPLALLQRYRAGTARRRARGWIATLNVAAIAISVIMLIVAAAVTTIWAPFTLTYTVTALVCGGVLGVVGLALTRWEVASRFLYYTPNKWLVLGITLVVAARILYGFLRGWHSWRAGVEGTSLLVSAGVAGTMAAGALVLGYYLLFWAGVRRRVKRHER